MELPRRSRGDELLPLGEMRQLRARLRSMAGAHDLTSIIAYAFDHRTRMLPFIYADMRMAPAGPRAVAAAMADIGFAKTRVVLQQWNRRFRPSKMRLDGRIPDLFMVSSMQLHGAECTRLLKDVCLIDEARRPLVIAGGPKVIYEPWDVFSTDPHDRWSADVAVTGEEYVLLSLLEVLLSQRAHNEPLRSTFLRARDGGMLDAIPGLVYSRSEDGRKADELVDTGIQRLVSDLDELPHASLGYELLEAPSRRETLGAKALEPARVGRYSPIGSLVMTYGCKFACPYCPIPAYNQRQHRVKSGERIADEMTRIGREFGVKYFFGADDNFFNDKNRTLEIVTQLARVRSAEPRRSRFRWATEATVHDTLKLRDELPLIRKAGLRAVWIGVEDMTATLIRKGQSVDTTTEALGLLREHGIHPMPMMMHHDEQPLISTGPKPYGLLNQVSRLRKAGAVSMQILMLVPATGSKLYKETYTSGMVFRSVGSRKVEQHMLGGNFVIASKHASPWIKQLNILIGYGYFYNPARFLLSLVRPKTKQYLADGLWQLVGMWGLMRTTAKTAGWLLRLTRGRVERETAAPGSDVRIISVDGRRAAHALYAPSVKPKLRKSGIGESSAKRVVALPVLGAEKLWSN